MFAEWTRDPPGGKQCSLSFHPPSRGPQLQGKLLQSQKYDKVRLNKSGWGWLPGLSENFLYLPKYYVWLCVWERTTSSQGWPQTFYIVEDEAESWSSCLHQVLIGVYHHIQVYVVLWIKLRTSCILGKYSSNETHSQPPRGISVLEFVTLSLLVKGWTFFFICKMAFLWDLLVDSEVTHSAGLHKLQKGCT